jgi:phosphoglycolate phosphatase-like HAD superfamily hydrolase
MATIRLGDATRAISLTFLDCDGVIFDVNRRKEEAFEAAVEGYPKEAVLALSEYHRANGGMSRYAKFRHFFATICPVDDPEPAIAMALQRFASISERAYDDLEPHPDAMAFAERMGGPSSVYVVSGADERELVTIFEAHGIRDRFAGILGSPSDKRVHMARILEERGIAGSDALVVGDGRADFEAARALGAPFVFLCEMSNWKDGRGVLQGEAECYLAETWSELLGW